MFLKSKSFKVLRCTVSALAIYSGSLVVLSPAAYAEVVEIGIDGAPKMISVSEAIQKRLALKFKRISKAKKWSRGALVQYYADADYKPLWVDENGLNHRAKGLMKVLGRSSGYGFVRSDFKTKLAANIVAGDEITSIHLAHIEIELSLAALKYINMARNGRFNPKKLSRFMEGTEEKIDAVAALNDISKTVMVMGYLESYHPSHPQYKALKKQLTVYSKPKNPEDVVVKMPVSGPTLKPGMTHPDVALLRTRLKIEANAVEDNVDADPEFYDSAVVAAVSKFQESKGLKADGYAGRRTRLAMNEGIVSNKARKEQILANMERWRWLPDDLGQAHIAVNIPEYTVRVRSEGEVIHKERVIVGKLKHKTPFFSDQMEKVVFNPYWNVPQSIIANEMNHSIPNGYEGHYNNGMLHVRQPPGPRNALGKVKFIFPNKHAVYLHDTPSKNLFNSKVRAFSHGCMRVRDPKRMAEVILSIGYKKASAKLVNKHWRTLRNAELPLDKKIPVHVTYFTASVDDNGEMKYYNDIYGHDKRITTALNGGRVYLEPKQRIKKRPPVRDSYETWGFFDDNSYGARRRYKKKKKYSSNFWGQGSAQKKRKKVRKQKRRYQKRRRQQDNFDVFGFGW